MVSTAARVTAALLIVLMGGAASSAAASPWSDELKLKIDENVDRHFQNQSQVGLIVGVIRENEVHFWSYGEKVLGSARSPDADTYFEMGSITKTYTATLLAMEALKGTLSIKDPISKFWKELEGTDAGAITFEELATHTSGLPRMPSNFVQTDPEDPYKDYDASLLFEFLKSFKQSKAGPYPYAYSNVGIGLLGHILSEKIHSLTFENYLYSNLLKPLGLQSTKVRLSSLDELNSARGYDSFFSPVPFWNLNVLEGAGVLKTTARDLLRYLQFNMEADSSFIGKAMRLAQKQLFPADSPRVTVGLAWGASTLGRHQIISHSGATGGYRANLIFDKTEKLGAIVLSNTDVSPACILATVFDVACEVPKYVPVDPAVQLRLIGKFEATTISQEAEIFLEKGHLGIQPEGQPKIKLWARSRLTHFIPEAGAELVFKESSDGTIDQFEFTQDGQTFIFNRI